MSEIRVSGEFELTVTIDEARCPKDIFERGAELDFPYRDNAEGGLTREGVIAHLAHNAAANGVEDISRLDGWADYPRGAVTFRVEVLDAHTEGDDSGE